MDEISSAIAAKLAQKHGDAPPEPEADDVVAEEYSPQLKEAGSDLASAFKHGDGESVTSALCRFLDAFNSKGEASD